MQAELKGKEPISWESTPVPVSPPREVSLEMLVPATPALSATTKSFSASSRPSPAPASSSVDTGKVPRRKPANPSDQLSMILASDTATKESLMKIKLENRSHREREAREAAAHEAAKAREHELKMMELRVRLATIENQRRNGFSMDSSSPLSPFTGAGNPFPFSTGRVAFPPPVSTPPSFPDDVDLSSLQGPSNSESDF